MFGSIALYVDLITISIVSVRSHDFNVREILWPPSWRSEKHIWRAVVFGKRKFTSDVFDLPRRWLCQQQEEESRPSLLSDAKNCHKSRRRNRDLVHYKGELNG